MRRIEQTKAFKKDFKRVFKGIYRNLLVKGGEFDRVVLTLANNVPLAPKYKDHPLHGNMEGSRECHIRSDLLLVYCYDGDELILLEMLGSHSEIFGL